MITRTCTNELDFNLPLVNGVCQKDSNGFGFLCMCGMPLCNGVSPLRYDNTCSSLYMYLLGVIYSLTAFTSR